MRTSPFDACSTLYGTIFISSLTSLNLRPMKRLMENTVFSGFVTAWRLATWPTSRSPFLAKPTTDGVMRLPSALTMTFGSLPSMTATTELVVPRSMPMILDISCFSFYDFGSIEYPVIKFRCLSKPEPIIVNSDGARSDPGTNVVRMNSTTGGLHMSQFPYQPQQQKPAWVDARTADTAERERTFIRSVYAWMFGGLILTALAAMWVVNSPAMQKLIFGT